MRSAAIAAAFIALCAGPVLGLTLDEAITTGIASNPEMKAFRLEEDAAKGQMQKAKLPPFSNPTIEGAFSLKERETGDPGGKFRNNQITVSQSVEIAGQRGLRINAATYNIDRVRLEVRDLERKLRGDIKDRFTEALYLRDKETLLREYVRLQEELTELVSVKYQAGDVAALEVNLSRVELGRTRKELLSASTEYANAVRSLSVLIGASLDHKTSIEGELLQQVPALPALEDLLSRVIDRPDVKAAGAEIKKSEAEERLVRRSVAPDVTWSYFQGKDERRNEQGGTLGITIPLFDRKQGARVEAKARLAQSHIRQAGVVKTAHNEIEEAYATAASSLRAIELFKSKVLALTYENMELFQLAFKEGKISFYDVRIAQRETIETRNAYLHTLLDAVHAFNALERAAGGEL